MVPSDVKRYPAIENARFLSIRVDWMGNMSDDIRGSRPTGAAVHDTERTTSMTVKCANCPLRKLDAFLPFTAEQVKFMQRFKVGELTVEPQTTLLLEGSNAPQLFTVLSGQGLRTKSVPGGRRQVVNFVFPGDFVGLQAGIMGEMGHSVEATTQMKLCIFDRSEIWSLFKTHPDRAYDLTWLSASEEMFL